MWEFLRHVIDQPWGNLLIIAGLCFLFVALFGIGDKFQPGKWGRAISALLGCLLLAYGTYAHVSEDNEKRILPAQKSVVESGPPPSGIHASRKGRGKVYRRDHAKHPVATMRLPSASTQSVDVSALIDNELKKLARGRILYNPPDTMRVGVTERIEVRISKDQLQDLAKNLSGRGSPKVEDIRVGSFMKLRLIGERFEIIGFDSEEQLVADDEYSQWCYDVTPVLSGDQKLSLIAMVRIVVPGAPAAVKDHPTLDRVIHVRVNPMFSAGRFMRSNWQWILGTLVLPVSVWAWKHRQATPSGVHRAAASPQPRKTIPK